MVFDHCFCFFCFLFFVFYEYKVTFAQWCPCRRLHYAPRKGFLHQIFLFVSIYVQTFRANKKNREIEGFSETAMNGVLPFNILKSRVSVPSEHLLKTRTVNKILINLCQTTQDKAFLVDCGFLDIHMIFATCC